MVHDDTVVVLFKDQRNDRGDGSEIVCVSGVTVNRSFWLT